MSLSVPDPWFSPAVPPQCLCYACFLLPIQANYCRNMSDFIFMSKTNMSVVDLCVGAGNSAVDMLIRPILSCTSLI